MRTVKHLDVSTRLKQSASKRVRVVAPSVATIPCSGAHVPAKGKTAASGHASRRERPTSRQT